MAKQEQILQQLGPQNPLVTPQQFSNTLRKIVELSGFRDASSFFKDIPAAFGPPAPPSPTLSPEEILAPVPAESTKAAVNATISASHGRIELIARILAEGMKKLFKGILFLVTTHQDKERMVRLRNEWVAIDPRHWNAGMDASINIGLGNGDTNERLQSLMMIMAKQEQILQQLGPQNPLVTPQQFSHTLRKIVELSGFRYASSFFQDIPADYVPPAPPAPKPSPEEILAQVQAESIKADIQKKAADLELQRQQMIMDDDLKRDQMAQDLYLKKYEIELKYNSQISTAEIDAAQNIDREAIRQQAALAQQQAAQFVQQPQPMQPMASSPINLNGMAQ